MSETTTIKDMSDLHRLHGREALRAALDTAAAAALETAAVPVLKSGISEILPSEKPEGGDSPDKTDLCAEEVDAIEPFPLDCLPGAAGDMAREVAQSALVPETLAGMNVLGILSASIGAGLEVASGGDRRTRAQVALKK